MMSGGYDHDDHGDDGYDNHNHSNDFNNFFITKETIVDNIIWIFNKYFYV